MIMKRNISAPQPPQQDSIQFPVGQLSATGLRPGGPLAIIGAVKDTPLHQQRLDVLLKVVAIMACIIMAMPSLAQTASTTPNVIAGQLHIGGMVYGGGASAPVNTSNGVDILTDDKGNPTNNGDLEDLSVTTPTQVATTVEIYAGEIGNVFGGGQAGRTFGTTQVTLDGGTVTGDLFGAGEGEGAAVLGGTKVLMQDGEVKGSIYGGADEARTVGCTRVEVVGGSAITALFGGSRSANVYGNTFVYLDIYNAKNDISVGTVYGGNDVTGTIGPANSTDQPNWTWAYDTAIKKPTEITLPEETAYSNTITNFPEVDDGWNAYIYATAPKTVDDNGEEIADPKTLSVDNLFIGGNGEDVETRANSSAPNLEKGYAQIEGGSYGSVYGGGNNATVTSSTDICLIGGSFDKVFGGNNKAEMNIRPNWYLIGGTITDLYSGGNAGAMTYYDADSKTGGIFLAIESPDLTVENVYGGCRMADVNPTVSKTDAEGNIEVSSGNDLTLAQETQYGVVWQPGYASRVLIKGGKVKNVYGGNDVAGIVYHGSQVEIQSTVLGDVYGAGNGSYVYTDINSQSDTYYNTDQLIADRGFDDTNLSVAQKSIEALNLFRPDAQKTYVHLTGSKTATTYVLGSVYCGGNSTTLRMPNNDLASAQAHLQIGPYVVADNVFLGSNGENMVKTDVLSQYADDNISNIDLTDRDIMRRYMQGVEVNIRPTVGFDKGYSDYSTQIGSLFLGGNVGSMTSEEQFTFDFDQKIVIYNKFVAGCNNANVNVDNDDNGNPLNAFCLGGLVNKAKDSSGNELANKVDLNLSNLRLKPQRIVEAVDGTFSLVPKYYYETLDLNQTQLKALSDFDKGVMVDGNVYGGCYTSGYVNGGVHITIEENTIDINDQYDPANYHPSSNYDMLASRNAVYGGGYGLESEIWGDVTIDITERGQALKVFGGSEKGFIGKMQRDEKGAYVLRYFDSSTPLELDDPDALAALANKPDGTNGPRNTPIYLPETRCNTTINLYGADEKFLTVDGKFNVVRAYGGGYEGIVTGNTRVNIDRTRAFDIFGGACNADIYGYPTVIVGQNAVPILDPISHEGETVTTSHYGGIYGGNDFGGKIYGVQTVDGLAYAELPTGVDPAQTPDKVYTQSYVEYRSGVINGYIFGGSCGAYNYDWYGNSRAAEDNRPTMMLDIDQWRRKNKQDPYAIGVNSFVNVISQATTSDVAHIGGYIFGAGQGLKGSINCADQMGSYLRLASNAAQTDSLSGRVFGAGYCSNTSHSLVDAYSGKFNKIFGGCYGMGFEESNSGFLDQDNNWVTNYTADQIWKANYAGQMSTVRLVGMVNQNMDIYGAGANAGSEESLVELYTGQAQDVYGASFDEGYTCASTVFVPKEAKVQVANIFGGARGKSHAYICDVSNAFVAYKSADARISGAIYGGNNNARFTRSTHIEVSVPVTKVDGVTKADIFGGGKGENTVVSFSDIIMLDGAEAQNIYGGGEDGRVLNSPSLRAYNLAAGERVPYYDYEDKDWKVYVPTTDVPSYYANDWYKEWLANGYIAQSDLEGNHMTIVDGDAQCNLDETDEWRRIDDATKNQVSTTLTWPGFIKYKYHPRVAKYHPWIDNQKTRNGLYVENVFEPEQGEPGEDGYKSEDVSRYLYPAYTPKGFSTPCPLYELGQEKDESGQDLLNRYNARLKIYTGAVVHGDAYGGGYGELATVSGKTDVRLLGGTVEGNIYGGGYGGDVRPSQLVRLSNNEIVTARTNVFLGAGTVTNSFGGGYHGDVYGFAQTTIGFEDVGKENFEGEWEDAYRLDEVTVSVNQTDASGNVTVKDLTFNNVYVPRTLTAGDPTVERSVYGGGQMGLVDCMTNLTINQGHIGYKYDTAQKLYVENVDLKAAGDSLLAQNGNVFGGGYGEGAFSYYPTVWIYGGVVRNSVYGGGEIASVGKVENFSNLLGAYSGQELAAQVGARLRNESDTRTSPGYTHVVMMNGEVHGNVFGGGRGFSYDLTGSTVSGDRFYSDGYVFGNTSVSIRGGTIGTDETLAAGDGNVFGGGNIGYVYTGAVKCVSSDQDVFYDANAPLVDATNDAYIANRFYTHKWQCNNCGKYIRSYLKPHACWACQRHNMPAAISDYTDFTQIKETVKKTIDNQEVDQDIEYVLSEDTRVVVSPYCKVMGKEVTTTDNEGNTVTTREGSITLKLAAENESKTFKVGEYVPTTYLNTLGTKGGSDKDNWDMLNEEGVTIRNAVFAGGNVSSGSDKVYANTTTVFGNATATLNDIYYSDLITIGQEHTGGLYGDGNLTFVDGYRELNITNYGTDFYNLNNGIEFAEYDNLTEREKAYFQLQYECQAACTDTKSGKSYIIGEVINEDTYNALELSNGASKEDCFKATAFTIYSGRVLNTIQRADFCGVFGSRISLQGAKDRVIETPDNYEYAVNRVGEISLNKYEYPGEKATTSSTEGTNSTESANSTSTEDNSRGNYFGLYSNVNYLGGLTSDVTFKDVRVTDNTVHPGDGVTSYEEWKISHLDNKWRNNGNRHNQVALATGIYLEILKEPATSSSPSVKDYGYVTGIIELALIDVATGAGGGYVYAKNEHGVRDESGVVQPTVSDYNVNARSNQLYVYTEDDGSKEKYQTSGNFIHSSKEIVDNCYPTVNSYTGTDASPAHYWYIRGDFYVYDQYISAYTGTAAAYTKDVDLPLTITLASNAKISLVNVQPNLYAYYHIGSTQPLGNDGSALINTTTYKAGDVIDFWAYSILNEQYQQVFVPEVYIANQTCYLADGSTIEAGTVYLPEDYEKIKDGIAFESKSDYDSKENAQKVRDFVRTANEVRHGTGYHLDVALTNPDVWNTYATPNAYDTNKDRLTYASHNGTAPSGYLLAPTYVANGSGVYGQQEYGENDLLKQSDVDSYGAIDDAVRNELNDQATVETCYTTIEELLFDVGTTSYDLQKGVGVSFSDYLTYTTANPELLTKFEEAYICNQTFAKDEAGTDYYLVGEIIPKSSYESLATTDQPWFEKAYIVTNAGLYGGAYYQQDNNYDPLQAWAGLNINDRENFTYNFDGLDVVQLSDVWPKDKSTPAIPSYMYPGYWTSDGLAINNSEIGHMGDYDTGWENKVYSSTQLIDYQAKKDNEDPIDRDTYVGLLNEKTHYRAISASESNQTLLVVTTQFSSGSTVYTVGSTIDQSVYNELSDDQKNKVTSFTFRDAGTYYVCREEYIIDSTEGSVIKDLTKNSGQYAKESSNDGEEYSKGSPVPVGTVISATYYKDTLKNYQAGYTIVGTAPIETSTLYVARQADMDNLSRERIITVIYQYEYDEVADDDIEHMQERHIINIHLQFENGQPIIGPLEEPSIVLPGTTMGMKVPVVSEGAYAIIGGGWEIYASEDEADDHRNGREFSNYVEPVYWYQDGQYLAYYAKTYLGKTYSNPVSFHVANYHDLTDVMTHVVDGKQEYMYIDHDGVARNPKIYLNGKSTDVIDEDGNVTGVTNELELLKQLFTDSQNPTLLDERVEFCQNLDFIFNSDVEAPDAFTAIGGGEDGCFAGTVHGMGHTVSGLTTSLFGSLCGDVYNLGVTGSFTGSGIADAGSGQVADCWIYTTNTDDKTAVKPVYTYGVDGRMINCYYPNWANYGTAAGANAATKQQFYSGEVAFNLNDFYLLKRHNDTQATAADGGYPTFSYEGLQDLHYIENLWADGDLLYRNASVENPLTRNLSTQKDTDGTEVEIYLPQYPDDYLMFGQVLTYGYDEQNRPFTGLPAAVNKDADTYLLKTYVNDDNRVLRAPAYFRSSEKHYAHYNAGAVFADKLSDAVTVDYIDTNTDAIELHHNMTAIDFTGYDDGTYALRGEPFYKPYLDYAQLKSMQVSGLTQNLLLYSPDTVVDDPETEDVNEEDNTLNVLTEYFSEPVLKEDPQEDGYTYRRIAKLNDGDISGVQGHVVKKVIETKTVDGVATESAAYYAVDNHCLIDKQDFNAPIAFSMDAYKMWYQRTPDRYVARSAGWEAVSLPFATELVTTQDKGEITHFYMSGDGSKYVTGYDSGHEYWLREYSGIGNITKENDETVLVATMDYPTEVVNGETKKDNNSFLWDYYYAWDSSLDENTDEYQKLYYNYLREYDGYAFAQDATPYIVGFPGETYYEFDLSGKFVPKNTYGSIDQLAAQTITWVSAEGAQIAVSDEANPVSETMSGVTCQFVPSYMNMADLAGAYVLNSDGDAFTPGTAEWAFRPYYTLGTAQSRGIDRITFGMGDDAQPGDIEQGDDDSLGALLISTKRGKIVVESQLSHDARVVIVDPAGRVHDSYVIAPDERIETPVSSGFYIVNRTKVVVK